MTLPIPLTRFVGREAELAEAATLLGTTRLLTLTGPGGAGKTRLALQLATDLEEKFPDGVWFVDLSPLAQGELVWDQVATNLDIAEPGAGGWPTTVGRHLAQRRALVMLDNCEHVVESAAQVAAALLAAAPGLKLVATSREPLGVGGEVTWALPPLSEADGVRLFGERARQARPDVRLRDEDAEAVRSICRRLDGLPLAIELAAARTRALTAAHIAAGLKDRLRMLPTGPRTAPARQSTLRASFEWSYELLTEAERALLRQLSVFAGGFDLEAALAVCPGASAELLAGLTDRSLIVFSDRRDDSEPRYRMLETVREFAADRLAEAGEVELLRTRHRDHYLTLAEIAEPQLLGPDEFQWRARLRSELDNFRTALAWSRDQGEAEALARIVKALIWLWATPGRINEFGVWIDAAMERAQDLSPRAAAQILNFECLLNVITRGHLEQVPAMSAEALRLARAVADKREMALALAMQALIAGLAGGAQAMRPYFEEALPLARAAGFSMGMLLAQVAYLVFRVFQSDPDETRRLADEAVSAAEAHADLHNRLFARGFAGIEALVHGRLADAVRILEAVVAEGRETIDSNYLQSLLFLAWAETYRGGFDTARRNIAQALEDAPKRGSDSVSIRSIAPIARWVGGVIELANGDAARASQSLAVVVAVARSAPVSHFASLPLVFLAQAEMGQGGLDEAEAFLDEAGALAQAGGLTWVVGRAARVRAEVQAQKGDLRKAESLANDALNLGREAGDQIGVVDALELLARLVAKQDGDKEAVRLWAAAESLRTGIGYVRFPVEQGPYDAAVSRARERLSPDEFGAVWAEGAKLSREEAIAYAMRGRGERKRPATGWASLTPSELEVARLVGEHLSNPEIAARLFVSRATVKTHLVHIFSKLGIDSRSQLAAQALRRTGAPE